MRPRLPVCRIRVTPRRSSLDQFDSPESSLRAVRVRGASPKLFPAEPREPRIGAEGIGLGVHADVEQRVGLFFASPLELLKCFVPPA